MSMQPRVVEGWRGAWRWASARLLLLMASMPMIYEYMQSDPYLKDMFSESCFRRAMSLLALVTLLSKIVRFDRDSA